MMLGFVVTPVITPNLTPWRICSILAVSKNNLITILIQTSKVKNQNDKATKIKIQELKLKITNQNSKFFTFVLYFFILHFYL
jgi:hypothetical protein